MNPPLLLATLLTGFLVVSSVANAGPQPATLVVHVVNDLNKNGVRDEGEPGLAGWNITSACSDAIYFSGRTGPDGSLVVRYYQGDTCLHVSIEFGWLPTSPASVEVDTSIGQEEDVVFLARHVGDDVAGFSGLVIVDGMPGSTSESVDAQVNGIGCGDGIVTRGFGRAAYELYVLSDAERSGCAREDDSVAFVVDSVPAGISAFNIGSSEQLDLIAGPIPMYFSFWYYAPPLEGAVAPTIEGQICGKAFPTQGGFVPANYQYVFVQSDESVEGCGSPGDIVNLQKEDNVLGQVLWVEGEAFPSELQYLGDANCDTRADSVDAALTLQASAGLVGQLECADAADVNRDGRLDSVDAALVLQLTAGLISYFP